MWLERDLRGYERNVYRVFQFLDLYWNFYSYNILDKLIGKLTQRERLFFTLKREIAVYKEDVERFKAETTLYSFIDYMPRFPKPPNALDIVAQCDWTEAKTLKDVDELMKAISHSLIKNKKWAVWLSRIQFGSVLITMSAIPIDFFEDEIEEKIEATAKDISGQAPYQDQAHALQSASRSVAISQTAQVEAEREDRIRASEAETSSSVEVDRTPHQDQPLVSPSTSSNLAASSNQAAKHSTKKGLAASSNQAAKHSTKQG
jgi:hypothetical protein